MRSPCRMHVVVLIILVSHNCCVPDTISYDHLIGVLNFMVAVSATHTKQFCNCFSVQLFCGEDCRWVLLHTDLCSSLAHTAIQWLHFVTPTWENIPRRGIVQCATGRKQKLKTNIFHLSYLNHKHGFAIFMKKNSCLTAGNSKGICKFWPSLPCNT